MAKNLNDEGFKRVSHAGFPNAAETSEDRPLDLHQLLIKRPASTFFMRASGDIDQATAISDGDLLIVDKSVVPSINDIVVATIDGDFVVCRFAKFNQQMLEGMVWGVVMHVVRHTKELSLYE